MIDEDVIPRGPIPSLEVLYLELANVVSVKTPREVELETEVRQLKNAIDQVHKVFNTTNVVALEDIRDNSNRLNTILDPHYFKYDDLFRSELDKLRKDLAQLHGMNYREFSHKLDGSVLRAKERERDREKERKRRENK